MKTKMLLIDKHMNCIEIEVSELNFRLLNVDFNKIKKHEKKRDLNVTISEFIQRMENEDELHNKSE